MSPEPLLNGPRTEPNLIRFVRVFRRIWPSTCEAVAAPDGDDRLDLCEAEIEKLPPGSRIVLRLHYLDGLTLLEIAEALELPVGTVKSRLAYGLAKLRAMLVST